jgi:hypothetical protein
VSTDPDLLRRAAEKLREHATTAAEVAPGPWLYAPEDPRPNRVVLAEGGRTAMAVVYEESELPKISAHIALMHPPVALALADWLDATAERIETLRPVLTAPADYTPEAYAAHIARTYAKPIAVARAVLREPDPTGGAT